MPKAYTVMHRITFVRLVAEDKIEEAVTDMLRMYGTDRSGITKQYLHVYRSAKDPLLVMRYISTGRIPEDVAGLVALFGLTEAMEPRLILTYDKRQGRFIPQTV